jgi:hypothetical protein
LITATDGSDCDSTTDTSNAASQLVCVVVINTAKESSHHCSYFLFVLQLSGFSIGGVNYKVKTHVIGVGGVSSTTLDTFAANGAGIFTNFTLVYH